MVTGTPTCIPVVCTPRRAPASLPSLSDTAKSLFSSSVATIQHFLPKPRVCPKAGTQEALGAWDHLCLEATHRLIQSSIRQRSLHIYCEPTHPSRPGTQRALPPGGLNPTRGTREGPALSTDVGYIMEHPRQRGRQGTFNHLCVQITATTAGNTYVTPSMGPAVCVGLQTHVHSFAPPRKAGSLITPISQGRKPRFQWSATCPDVCMHF